MNPEAQTIAVASPPYPRGGRLEYLDVVRGLAALSVVFFHYFQAYGYPPVRWLWMRTPLSALCDGTAAVSMFFVLSGLVLSLRYFKSSAEPDLSDVNLMRFAVARMCRIWLPFVAITLVSVLLPRDRFVRHGTSPAPTDWIEFYWSHPQWPLSPHFVIRDCLIFRTEHPALVPQGWTLSVELVLSLLVPVGVLVAKRGSIWVLATVGIAVVCLRTTPFLLHFTLGILLAKYAATWQKAHPKFGYWRWILLVVGILLYTARAIIPIDWGWDDRRPTIWWLTGAGSALILLYLLSSALAQRLLSWRPLVHLGRISYSVYLVHMAVLFCLVPVVLSKLPAGWHWENWAIALVLITVTTLLLADLSYRFVEMPTIRLGKWLAAAIPSGRTKEFTVT